MIKKDLTTKNGVSESSISQDNVNNSNLYLDETDSKGVPLLKRIEKYPDLPETEFIPIEYTHYNGVKIPSKYYINKLGETMSVGTRTSGKLHKHYNSIRNKYVVVGLNLGNNRTTPIRVHRLVASTFLVNPNIDKYPVVNHIDHNPENNSLSNLEWVSNATNSSERNLMSEDKLVNYVAMNDKYEELFRITRRNSNEYRLDGITNSIKNNKKYKGYYWRVENKKEKIVPGFSGNLDDYEWHEHWKYPGYFVCKEGFIKNSNSILGYINPEGYIEVGINKVLKRAHRIIVEFILKRDLKDNEIVDHINTVRHDNSFSNLRVTDTKGNMNNPNTLAKLYKYLVLVDLYGNLVSYGTTEEINNIIYKDSKVLKGKMDNSSLLRYNFLNKKYICSLPGDNETLLKKLSNIYYVLYKDKLVAACISLSSLVRDFSLDKDPTTIKRLVNKNLFLDGYAIIQGVEAVQKIISLGYGNVFKFSEYYPDFDKIPISKLQVDDKIREGFHKAIKKFTATGKLLKRYDLFGNFIDEFSGRREASRKLKLNSDRNIISVLNRKAFTFKNHLFCNSGEEEKIENDLMYIYYRFNKDNIPEKAGTSLLSVMFNDCSDLGFKSSNIRKKYLNTGMSAPDGYYYQQGDPKNMLYDPENTSYTMKREEIKWKSNKKLNNKNNE